MQGNKRKYSVKTSVRYFTHLLYVFLVLYLIFLYLCIGNQTKQTMENNYAFTLRHIFTKGDASVSLFDYSKVYEALVLKKCGQEEVAERAIADLESKGLLSLEKLANPMFSNEVVMFTRILRSTLIKRLKELLEEFEVIDTIVAVQSYRSHTREMVTLDEIVDYVFSNDLLKFASDWAALLMLADDLGKHIDSKVLRVAISNNAKSLRLGVPSRQTLYGSYVEHKNSQRFPNWPRTNEKQNRYFKIANSIYELVKNMVM